MRPSLDVPTTVYYPSIHSFTVAAVNNAAVIRDVYIPTRPPVLSSVNYLELLCHMVLLFNFFLEL